MTYEPSKTNKDYDYCIAVILSIPKFITINLYLPGNICKIVRALLFLNS